MGLDIGGCVCGKGGRARRKTQLSPSSPKAPEELLTMASEPSAPQQGHQQPQVGLPADPSPGKQEWLPTSFPIKSLRARCVPDAVPGAGIPAASTPAQSLPSQNSHSGDFTPDIAALGLPFQAKLLHHRLPGLPIREEPVYVFSGHGG